jgi:hypothetical protein
MKKRPAFPGYRLIFSGRSKRAVERNRKKKEGRVSLIHPLQTVFPARKDAHVFGENQFRNSFAGQSGHGSILLPFYVRRQDQASPRLAITALLEAKGTSFLFFTSLGKFVYRLPRPPVVGTGIPALPFLFVHSLRHFLLRPELPHSGFITQVFGNGLSQIVVFDHDVSQADLGIPNNRQTARVIVFSDEEDIL